MIRVLTCCTASLALLLAGCPEKNPCQRACNHLAKCAGDGGALVPCPFEDACGPYESCLADCVLNASCEAITGQDPAGAAAFKSCQAQCATVGDGGVLDGLPDGLPPPHIQYFPQTPEKDIDILFMVDNSNSMAEEQKNLTENFPKLIDALRTPKLGDKIPNVHIGVITSDLGAGDYNLPSCEATGGDGGKLQAAPKVAGCTPPSEPYISYIEGVTNIQSDTADPVEQVKQAFQCIAEVGTGGCGFEQSLESARKALSPGVNPGFVRPDAYLAIVLITDEDDCSAAKPQLYDLLDETLGPPTSFRCFQHGFTCNEADLSTAGPKTGCTPGQDWLRKVDNYVTFFKSLKPAGRVLLFAVAGPADKVEVGAEANDPVLKPSCQTTSGKAVPAIRLKALTDAFGTQGHFNEGVDETGTKFVGVTICNQDFSPALRLLGQVIVATLGGQCLSQPLLTKNGGLVCQQGDLLAEGVTCAQSCLDQAECIVKQVTNLGTPQEKSEVVAKCDAAKFANPADKDCGSTCPCWRVVRNMDCRSTVHGSPYALEILRQGSAVPGTVAQVACAALTDTWGSSTMAALPQCK
jgi:hypothetical protein